MLAHTAKGLANTSNPDDDDEEEFSPSLSFPSFSPSTETAAETDEPRAQVPGSVASSALIAADLSADKGSTGEHCFFLSRSSFLLLSSASRLQRARIEPPSPRELRRSFRPGRTTTPSAVRSVIFS